MKRVALTLLIILAATFVGQIGAMIHMIGEACFSRTVVMSPRAKAAVAQRRAKINPNAPPRKPGDVMVRSDADLD